MRSVLILSCVLGLLGLSECSRAYYPQPLPDVRRPSAVTDDRECEACVWGIRIAEDILADPAIVAKLADKIEEMACKQLDQEARDQCTQYVSMLLPVAVQYLVHLVPVEELCADASMCTGRALTARSLGGVARKGLSDPLECSFCEFAVQAVQQAIADHKEQEQLLEEARAACKALPPSFADICVQYVNNNGPLIIALLETQDPQNVCTLMQACDSSGLRATAPLPREVTDIVRALGSLMVSSTCSAQPAALGLPTTQNCEFCKVAVMEIHDKLEEPAFQQALVAYAKQACSSLGKDFSDQCAMMVDQYAPLVFAMLEDQLQPEKFCEEIHMCEPVAFAF